MAASPRPLDWSFLARQHQEFVANVGLPLPEPCLALPGTREKVAVVRLRAMTIYRGEPRRLVKAREQLFHPEDATWDMFWRLMSSAKNPKSRWRAPFVVLIDGVGYNWHCPVTPLEGFNPLETRHE